MSQPKKMSMNISRRKQLNAEFNRRLRVWIKASMDGFSEHLDEHFFGLAEQAVSDGAQRHYIDAIRELRQGKTVLTQQYEKRILLGCEKFFLDFKTYQRDFLNTQIHIGEDHNSMELINQDVLEEDLAVMRVAHQMENKHLSSLKKLTELLSTVSPIKLLKSSEIPASPHVFSHALQYVLQDWSGDLQTKLTIYEVYGKYCLNSLDELYSDLENILERAGVLPAEAEKIIAPKPKKLKAKKLASKHHPVNMGESTLFGVVALIRQLETAQREILGLSMQDGAQYSQNWPVAGAEAIVNIIENLQSEFFSNPPKDMGQARLAQRIVKQQLLKELDVATTTQKMRLQKLDQHVIDVVNLLFEYILEDPVIPAQMKILLARLQMPVLRIAIEDKTLLTDRTHPVRETINHLGSAAARWADEGDYTPNSIYGRIEQSVQHILENPHAEVDLWERVDREFQTYVSNEERGVKVAEERLSQVAKGKERLSMARRAVDLQLAKLLPEAIPAPVYQIIDEVWRDVMTLTLLREGEFSDDWKNVVRTLEALLDSVVPRADLDERQMQIAKVPGLLAELRKGFASISFDSSRASTMFKQLQHCHVTALRGLQPATMRYGEEDRKALAGDLEGILEDEFTQQVDNLKYGVWVAWHSSLGKELRGKLAWRSQVADLLIFVDMRGRRVAEMSSSELADLFRNQQATELSNIDRPVIERVLSAIYNTLSRQLPGHILPA